MTVKVFRMLTGEDIITTVKESISPEVSDKVIMQDPAQIILQKQGEQVGVAIAPYLPLIDGEVEVYKTAIVAEGIPDQALINEYNVKFGSGLVVANTMPNIKLQ